MNIVAIFLFALSANIDSFTVAITYGVRKIRIGLANNLLIATISSIGTLLSMYAGSFIGRFLPPIATEMIGSFILIGIGLFTLKGTLVKKKPPKQASTSRSWEDLLKSPEIADVDHSGSIDVREAGVLALALTINNAGLGIGAGFAGFSPLLTTLITFGGSVLSIAAGCAVGKLWASRISQNVAQIIASLLIIGIGLYELIPCL